MRHFADDTNLLYSIKKKEQNRNRNIIRNLNTDLKSLNHWLLANKISLNSTKTELIFFRKLNKPIPNVKIKLNGITLTESSEIKYVGVTFDEHLKVHYTPQNCKLGNSFVLLCYINSNSKRTNSNLLAISAIN